MLTTFAVNCTALLLNMTYKLVGDEEFQECRRHPAENKEPPSRIIPHDSCYDSASALLGVPPPAARRGGM